MGISNEVCMIAGVLCAVGLARGHGEGCHSHCTCIAVHKIYVVFSTEIFASGGSTFEYGQNVTLMCILVNGPPSVLVWEVPPASTSLSRGMTYDQQNSSILTFTALENDTGNYTCHAAGISDSTSVTVGKPLALTLM